MKKFVTILFLLTCLSFSYGQEIIFSETCGNMDVSSPRKVDTYSGWDNSVAVTFSRSTALDGYADVRCTSTTTNHVWFPSGKNSDLIISNIPSSNYKNLKLSFDIATYKLADANVNKLHVVCNETPISVPGGTFSSSKFIPVTDISLPESDFLTLKFQYTAENNLNGYRLDNITITGEKITSVPNDPINGEFRLCISENKLVITGVPDGAKVEIFNLSGSTIQASTLHDGSVELNNLVKKGFYLVRVNHLTRKMIY